MLQQLRLGNLLSLLAQGTGQFTHPLEFLRRNARHAATMPLHKIVALHDAGHLRKGVIGTGAIQAPRMRDERFDQGFIDVSFDAGV